MHNDIDLMEELRQDMLDEARRDYIHEIHMRADYDYFISYCGITEIHEELESLKAVCDTFGWDFYELIEGTV